MSSNQLRRQNEEVKRLSEELEANSRREADLLTQLREAQRRFSDLEGRMKEDLMMARIRDAENTQCVAELTQKISNLEYKVVTYIIIIIRLNCHAHKQGIHNYPNYKLILK